MSIFNKVFSSLRIIIIAGLVLCNMSVAAPALAAIYQPGETLNPSCGPNDLDCGVAISTHATGIEGQVITFNTNGDQVATSTLFISGNNVGIGTVVPITNLDISGNARISTTLSLGSHNPGALSISANWKAVGNAAEVINISVTDTALTSLTSTFVAYIDSNNDQLRTYQFDGTDWTQVGNPLPITSVSEPAIVGLSSTRIAYFDTFNNQLRTYDFDGTDWSQVGNSFLISGAGVPALAKLSATQVAFADDLTDNLTTYQFDGTNWSQVGNSLAFPGLAQPSIVGLSSSRIVFYFHSSNPSTIQAYDFNGTTWSAVGNARSVPTGLDTSMAMLTASRIAFVSNTDILRAYDFDGTNWTVGQTLGIPGLGGPDIAALTSTRVAVVDASSFLLQAYDHDVVDTDISLIAEGAGVFGGTNTNGYTLYVNGTTFSLNGVTSASDERYKKEITNLDSALDKVLALRGVSYDWRTDEYPSMSFDDRRQMGFIAQEVAEIVPELVSVSENGFLALNYDKLTPLIVSAMQEQYGGLQGLEFTTSTDYDEVFASESSLEDLEAANADQGIVSDVIGYIGDKVGSGIKIVRSLVSERVVAIEGYFKRVFANELCLINDDGNLVCVTGKALESLSGAVVHTEGDEPEENNQPAPEENPDEENDGDTDNTGEEANQDTTIDAEQIEEDPTDKDTETEAEADTPFDDAGSSDTIDSAEGGEQSVDTELH